MTSTVSGTPPPTLQRLRTLVDRADGVPHRWRLAALGACTVLSVLYGCYCAGSQVQRLRLWWDPVQPVQLAVSALLVAASVGWAWRPAVRGRLVGLLVLGAGQYAATVGAAFVFSDGGVRALLGGA